MPDGRFIAIEVKTEQGKLTPEQRLFLFKINENNGIGFVARSIEDVKKELIKVRFTKRFKISQNRYGGV